MIRLEAVQSNFKRQFTSYWVLIIQFDVARKNGYGNRNNVKHNLIDIANLIVNHIICSIAMPEINLPKTMML